MTDALERDRVSAEIEPRLALAKARIRQTIGPLRLAFLLGAILEILEGYRFLTEGGSARDLIGILSTLASGILLLLTSFQLARESKLALYLVFGALGFGALRWVVTEPGFEFTLPAFLLIALFAWFVGRFVHWVRIGALR
jgi:hypothetical protein